LTRATGLSSAMVTRILSGERFGTASVLERIRQAFRVKPSELFDPDAALAQIGLQRRDSVRHTDVAHTPGDPVDSPSPNSVEGGSALLRHPDRELLAALLAYWDDMTPEARLELVGHGHRLRKLAAATALTVGFKRG
jgi:transcriptional regulator with XRE-family HTH domain